MSNPIGDRNLLFGIVAVQKNIIGADAFVAGMREWSADKRKGLAQILREQNAITENHHAVLEEIVDQNLAQHGNDARKCLALLGLAGAARQGLEEIGDADLSVGLAQVPIEAPKPPPKKPAAPAIEVVKPAAAKKPEVKPHASAPAKPSRMPGWVLLAGGAAVGVLVAVAAVAAVLGALFLGLTRNPAANDKVEPVAQEKPVQNKLKVADQTPPPATEPPREPAVVKPPVKAPDEPVVVKPPVAAPPEPVLVKPAVVKGGLEAEFILELPRPAGRALLSADGLRIAYTTPNTGSFDYREAPAFDNPKTAAIAGVRTQIHPLASTVDGKRMAFTASADGPKIFLWNWATMSVEKTFPFTNLAINSVFSPDGRFLATYLIQIKKDMAREHWFHLHDIAAGKAVSQWQLTGEPALFGFTPDGRKVFFATKADQAARAWSVDDGEPSVLPFAQITKRHTFARDFSKFAYVETPTKLRLGLMDGLRSLGTIDINKESNHIKAAAYAPDNRFVLVGTEDFSRRPLVTGKAMLVDLVSGKTIAVIDKLDGVPDQAEIAANGVALFQGPKLLPCLYRFPTAPDPLLVNAPVAPTPGFTPLFNGKDLTGWKRHEMFPGKWRVENGILVGDGPNSGVLHTMRSDYQDFHLRMEARFSAPGASSGVLCRSEGGRFGYESLFFAGKLRDGVYVRRQGVAPQIPPAVLSNVQSGDWFTLEFIVQGNRLKVLANGKETADYVDEAKTFASGQIALRQGTGSKLEFRKIEIKERNAVAARPPAVKDADDGFVPLFNGKDLTGWKSNRLFPGDWRVVDGILTGSGKNLRELYTPRDDYGDFHLRLEGRINDDGNGFVVFRYPHGPAELTKMTLGGYAARINSRPAELAKTGSLFVYDGAGVRTYAVKDPLVRAGQWFLMEIIAKENLVVIKVNGQETMSFLNPKDELLGGRIVLGFSDSTRKTVMEYRKIEIKEFKPVAAAPPPAPRRLAAYVPLFSRKDLAGWRLEGNGAWKLTPDGDLIGEGPDAALLTNRKDFKNFNVKIELSASADVDGFLALRQNPGVAGRWLGLTSRLTGDGALVRAGFAGVDSAKKEKGSVQVGFKPGLRYKLEFQVEQSALRVFASGRATGGLNFAPDRHPAGAIGFYLTRGTVRIHKFEIAEELPDAPPAVVAGDFVPLFNGKDLTGWQPHLKTAANWRVEKGILTGAGEEAGILHTARADYQDFHLRLQTRFTVPADADNNSVVFRSPFGRAGYETACADGKFAGGLYLNGKDFGKPVAAKFPANIASGEWFNLEIVAKANRLTVKVNGKETNDFVDDEHLFKSGHIALRQGAGSKVEIRTAEIRELKPAIAAPPPELPPAKGAFAAVFNGKDLIGWQPHAKRPGNWRVENGILIGSAPNGGALYSARNDYQDFHLRAEVRINDKGFGRIFGRAAYDPTKIPFKVIGYEVLINQRPLGDKSGTLTATSLLSTKMTPARETPTAPGEWFLLEMLAKGDLVTVKVNGVAVADFQDAQRQFARTGHIALHQDANAVIEFRKVEIDDLNAPKADVAPPPRPVDPPEKKEPPEGGMFVPLFNGKDLAGWKTFGKDENSWRVENGILIGSGKNVSRIHSPRDDYKNYHLRVEACIHDLSAAGVFVRAPLSPFKGYQALINSTHPGPNKTGSLEAHVPGKPINLVSVTDPPVPFGAWFTMEIIVQGKRITVLVNGKTTADFSEVDDAYLSGHIALRHEPGATVEFRKIEIRELPAQGGK